MLNELQQQALRTAAAGHNFVLTGQAGSGKTVTVKKIVEIMKSGGKRVQVTCTTGMACMQYYSDGMDSPATTIHAWSGMQDGRYTVTQLCHLMQTNEKFMECQRRILNTDVLIIDEVSMLSLTLFEQLESLCRWARKCQIAFGGIQVITAGDFFQLSPVPSLEYADGGEFCFLSDRWLNCFPHHINLTQVMRQDEQDLVTAVSELARGEPSHQTNSLMTNLSRCLPTNVQPVKLCAKNIDVDLINDEMLSLIDGDATTYKSIDQGQRSGLKKIRAQMTLNLKIGCPVILIVNLTPPLVNGLQGSVTALDSDGPTVFFKSVNIAKKMEQYTFSVNNRNKNTAIASRKQFPLRLAYSLTIHKAQGMSLEYVEVDCKGATFPGQIAVAIGRARKKAGLRIKNYHPSLVKKPQADVVNFYSSQPILIEDDPFLCCKNSLEDVPATPEPLHDDELLSDDSELSDFTPAEIEDAETAFASIESDQPGPSTSTQETHTTDHSLHPLKYSTSFFKPIETLFSQKYTNPSTTEQEQINNQLSLLDKKKTEIVMFGKDVWDKLNGFYEEHCSSLEKSNAANKSKKLNKFHSAVFSLMNDRSIIPRILFGEPISDTAKSICSKFTLNLSSNLLQWKSSVVATRVDQAGPETKEKKYSCKMSEDGKGKVRYVGGMCVAKLRLKAIYSFRKHVHSKTKPNKAIAEKSKDKISICDSLEESYSSLAETTSYPQSLVHTQRKQNERCGLTHISDKCFEFFLEVEKRRSRLSTVETLHEHRDNALVFVKGSIKQDESLLQNFLAILSSLQTPGSEGIKTEVFNELLEHYINVGNSEYRKLLKDKFVKKKKFSHRIEVAKSSEVGKERKRETGKESEPEASCSTKKKMKHIKSSRKAKASTSVADEEDDVRCPMCNKHYEEGEDWICCDVCNRWLDRACAGLSEQSLWEDLTNTEKEWICQQCSVNK